MALKRIVRLVEKAEIIGSPRIRTVPTICLVTVQGASGDAGKDVRLSNDQLAMPVRSPQPPKPPHA
jgi:hypothetical protein